MRIPGPRTRRGRIITAAAVAAVASASLGTWWVLREEEPAQARSLTEEVGTTTLSETVTASGTLRAKKSQDLSFDVSGTVTKVLVEAGDTVKKGARLAKVDPTHLEAARTAASSAVTAAREALSEALESDADSTRVAALRSQLAAAEADAEQAQEDVVDAVLRAPFAGTVTAVDLEVGDRVGSANGSASGSGGATGGSAGQMGGAGTGAAGSSSSTSGAIQLATTGRFAVDAEVSATDVEKVKEGLQAELSVNGVEETVYGTVTDVGRLASASSSGSAVFDVTVEVTGERTDLHAGTSTDLAIIVSKRTDVLSVSTRAVQRDDEGTYVTVVEDGKQERRAVEVGQANGPSTEITSGLEEGETVLVQSFAGRGRDGSGGQGGAPGGEMPDMSNFQPPAGGFPDGFPGGSGGGFPGGGR